MHRCGARAGVCTLLGRTLSSRRTTSRVACPIPVTLDVSAVRLDVCFSSRRRGCTVGLPRGGKGTWLTPTHVRNVSQTVGVSMCSPAVEVLPVPSRRAWSGSSGSDTAAWSRHPARPECLRRARRQADASTPGASFCGETESWRCSWGSFRLAAVIMVRLMMGGATRRRIFRTRIRFESVSLMPSVTTGSGATGGAVRPAGRAVLRERTSALRSGV